jgi:hypothetical protein
MWFLIKIVNLKKKKIKKNFTSKKKKIIINYNKSICWYGWYAYQLYQKLINIIYS